MIPRVIALKANLRHKSCCENSDFQQLLTLGLKSILSWDLLMEGGKTKQWQLVEEGDPHSSETYTRRRMKSHEGMYYLSIFGG